MNKVYKVIWSKVRNCYVVVSELAKRNGKCSSSLNKKIIAAFLAAGMTMAATVSVEANAVGVNPGNTGTVGTATGANSVAVGDNAISKGSYAIAVGNAAKTGRNAILAEAQIGAYNALQATIKNDAAFAGVTAVQNATNYAALVSALNSVGTAAANSYVTQLNNRVTSLQNAAPTSTNAIAVGNNATAGGASAIAVGNAATALKEDGTAANSAIAVGNGAKARNTNAIAIGPSNGSFSQYGLSDQITTGAWGQHDIAIGTDAAAHGERKDPTDGSTLSSILDGGGKFAEGGSGYAIAVGYRAQALRQYAIAVGEQAMATGNNATAIGHGARALTRGSIVIGGEGNGTAGIQQGVLNTALDALDTIEEGGYSIAIGNKAMNFTTNYDEATSNYFANTKNSIAIGHYAHTHAANAFAIGVSTDATAERSFAIGTTSTNIDREHKGARAGGQGSLTFGDQAVVGVKKPSENSGAEERGGHVLVNDAMAMGTNSWAQARNAVALGGGMSYTYHNTSADGKTMTNITKYYDVSQKKWVDIAEGTGAHVGLNADGGVAIGGATGTVNLNGSESHWPTTAPGAVTGYTKAAQATVARSVALGTGSVANREAMNPMTGTGTAPAYATSGYDVSTGKAYVGTGKDSAIWKSTLGAFSVGEETGLSKDANDNIKSTVVNTRQITGVAAGSADTDAVNVAQLKRVSIAASDAVKTATDTLRWKIGITDDGGTNGTKLEDGTYKNALPQSVVGKIDSKTDKSNVTFVAGNGIDISSSTVTNGYGVKISSKFIELKPTIEGGHFAGSIVYEGDDGKPHEYFLTGGGASVVDVISDKRATVAEAVTKESKDADGNKVYNHSIEIFTPYIEISGTDKAKEKDFAKASGDNAIALGHQAEAAAENTIAMGHNADAKSEASTAIGYNSHAHGPGSVSIGVAATTSGNRAIAIGTTARNVEDVNYETSNPHQGARAAGQGSIVLGDRARALSQEYQGTDERIGTPDTAVNDAIAVGTRAEVRARNAIAIGGNSSYSYTDKDTGKLMTVYGNASGRQVGAVVGDEAYSGIAIGGAYGSFDENTKTVNEEMSAAATYGIRGIAIGSGALVANPDDFRDLQKALSDKTYISYKKAFEESRSNYLAALSAWNTIKDITPNDPSMPYSMRVTKEEKAAAENRYNSTKEAMTKATANYSMALKEVVRLQQKDSVLETDAIAIGTQANASVRDSIALGSKSVTNTDDRAGVRTGISGYDPLSETSDNDYFRGGMVGGTKYEEDDPVWRSTAGSLSVGGGTTTVTNTDGEEVKVTVTRRISNVAAGVNDSDAVNVAQLKRATTFSTDSRNTTLGVDEEGKMSISSPYLNIKGVGATAEHTSIIKQYKTAEAYKASLDEEGKEIAGRIASINKTRSLINDSLKTLEADYKAQKISEADYRLHKLEYDDQLTATSYRLNDLNTSLKEIKTKSANAATVFAEAKGYYDSQANASGTDSIAIGNKAASGGKDSITLGQNNRIGTAGAIDADADTDLEKEGARSIAIGSNNTITGTKETDSSTDSIAIGTGNTITGTKSIAVGTGHTIKASRAGAFGDPITIGLEADGSYGIGNNIEISTPDTFAFGSNIKTTAANSVFLGKDTAYVAAGNRTAGLRTDYTSDTFNGQTYKYAGGDQVAGVVSVGNENETRRIQNVAPGLIGPESTDAINGSQLYNAMNQTANQIGGVEHRMKKGLAGAAALAALHPLDFDPDDKLTFAAGMGHYRGENAAALGMFYRPDEKVMFSVGGTMGNGENMINAGVSFSLDRTARVTGSRTALTKEVVQLREHVAKQDAQIAELTALVKQLAGNAGLNLPAGSALPGAPALFPDNLDNKWAYDTLEELEQKGYIHGYAGRALSRQQFAAALDRAMAGGAKLDERIVKEFEPELSHVRVAHVEGHGNNEGEWYERPRASHDRYEDKQKIEKKHFRVQEKKVTSKS